MTLEQVRQLAEELRCDVTINRCAEFGCATPGATIMPALWRCPTCAVYWALQQLVLAEDLRCDVTIVEDCDEFGCMFDPRCPCGECRIKRQVKP